MGIPLQGLTDLGRRPPVGQQPERMPAFALPWCRRTVHLLPHVAHIDVPPLEDRHHVVHRATSAHPLLPSTVPHQPCGFHPELGLDTKLMEVWVNTEEVTVLHRVSNITLHLTLRLQSKQ